MNFCMNRNVNYVQYNVVYIFLILRSNTKYYNMICNGFRDVRFNRITTTALWMTTRIDWKTSSSSNFRVNFKVIRTNQIEFEKITNFKISIGILVNRTCRGHHGRTKTFSRIIIHCHRNRHRRNGCDVQTMRFFRVNFYARYNVHRRNNIIVRIK